MQSGALNSEFHNWKAISDVNNSFLVEVEVKAWLSGFKGNGFSHSRQIFWAIFLWSLRKYKGWGVRAKWTYFLRWEKSELSSDANEETNVRGNAGDKWSLWALSLWADETRCDLVEVKGWPGLLITATRAEEVIDAGTWVDAFIRSCFEVFFWSLQEA